MFSLYHGDQIIAADLAGRTKRTGTGFAFFSYTS